MSQVYTPKPLTQLRWNSRKGRFVHVRSGFPIWRWLLIAAGLSFILWFLGAIAVWAFMQGFNANG